MMRLCSVNRIAKGGVAGFVAVLPAFLVACAPLPEIMGRAEEGHARWEAQQRLIEEYRERNGTGVTDVAAADRGHHGAVEQAARTRLRMPTQAIRGKSGEVSGGAAVSVHFSNVPLRLVAHALATLTTTSIVVAEEIAAELVTLRVMNTPWRDVLSAIARTQTQSWVLHDEEGFISIGVRREEQSTASGNVGYGVDLLRFSHIAPDDMKKAAMPLFAGDTGKPVMSVDERTGALMVKGSSGDVDLVAVLARELDQPVQQILIETFIVEASEGVERSLGARLGVNRSDSGGIIRVGGTIGSDQTAVNLPVAAPAAGLGFLFDSERLRLELTALEKEGKTRIISNPRVFTLNGHEAMIFQGDEVPYTSVSENGTQTEFKEAGVRLAVTPMIVGADRLILDVTVNKDTVDTRVQNPPITRRQIKTRLLIADGATVIIGGIYFDTRVKAETRVPVLGRLPVLGHLFKRSQNTRDFRELLVFIAPKIVGASS